MRILSKKRYQFGRGDDKFITAGNGVIETAPDWIINDELFNLAKDNHNIEVLEVPIQVDVAKDTKSTTKKG